MAKVNRRTVNLCGYPGLVVVYLGMRVNALTRLKTLLGFGPKIAGSVEAQPDSLLLHENLIYPQFPPHNGMRQYWRDFELLEDWAKSEPQRAWWKKFLRDSGGPAAQPPALNFPNPISTQIRREQTGKSHTSEQVRCTKYQPESSYTYGLGFFRRRMVSISQPTRIEMPAR